MDEGANPVGMMTLIIMKKIWSSNLLVVFGLYLP